MKMKIVDKQFAVSLCLVILVASLTAVFFETQQASASPIRVACVGDSITSDSAYTDVLSTLLGDNYTVGNFGVGRTTVSLDFNKPYMNQSACQDAQKFNPDIVVVMLGTNDAYLSDGQRSNFVNDYKELIAQFQSLANAPDVYIVIPPPVFNNTSGLLPAVLDNQVIPLVNQTATDLKLPTIDVHTPLLSSPGDFVDGVHPNSAGSEVIASEIYGAVT